jgi:putative ABC transport system permease protein
MVPLKYNVRNLKARGVTTLLTVVGTAALVWCSCILFGMVEGFQHSLNVSGEPEDLLILRKGSTSEVSGGFALAKAQDLTTLDGIALSDDKRPLISLESLDVPIVERDNGGRTNLMVRGVEVPIEAGKPPVATLLRKGFQLVEGRMLEPGKSECIIARPISRRIKNASIGETLRCGDKAAYRVVGIFIAGGGTAESEVWVDRVDLDRYTQNTGSVSSVQMRSRSPADLKALQNTIENDTRFVLKAWNEPAYYAEQQLTGDFLKLFGAVIAVLLTLGAMFATTNTMLAAVSNRMREIGTMRAIGFSRFEILISFLFESLLLCALGGVLGLLLTLPLSMFTFGSALSFFEQTFSFRFGPLVMGTAFGMVLAMGLFGGLFPAFRAVNMSVINALREL